MANPNGQGLGLGFVISMPLDDPFTEISTAAAPVVSVGSSGTPTTQDFGSGSLLDCDSTHVTLNSRQDLLESQLTPTLHAAGTPTTFAFAFDVSKSFPSHLQEIKTTWKDKADQFDSPATPSTSFGVAGSHTASAYGSGPISDFSEVRLIGHDGSGLEEDTEMVDVSYALLTSNPKSISLNPY
jgi:hypothetical protein